MKIYHLLFLSLLAVTSCSNDNKKQSGVPDNAINPDVMKNPATASSEKTSNENLPAFQFETETHDFGTIAQGEKVSYAFKFKNAGKSDLVISSASGSCGCTVPEWPHEPVPPGGRGIINVTFDSSGKQGHQDKTVTIISNTIPNNKVLTITGTVDIPADK